MCVVRTLFREKFAAGMKDAIYPVLKWVLPQHEKLAKRAFVGFYLSFPDVSLVSALPANPTGALAYYFIGLLHCSFQWAHDSSVQLPEWNLCQILVENTLISHRQSHAEG